MILIYFISFFYRNYRFKYNANEEQNLLAYGFVQSILVKKIY